MSFTRNEEKIGMVKSAVLSEDGKYRYSLSRSWGQGYDKAVFLMMNPSTADAEVDDATIRKCMGFAKRWEKDGIEVVNLFALRSRDPKVLLSAVDPVGPHNLSALRKAMWDEEEVICAWGCESTLRANKGQLAMESRLLLAELQLQLPQSVKFYCLGKTKGGTPRHPLMLPYSTPLEPL